MWLPRSYYLLIWHIYIFDILFRYCHWQSTFTNSYEGFCWKYHSSTNTLLNVKIVEHFQLKTQDSINLETNNSWQLPENPLVRVPQTKEMSRWPLLCRDCIDSGV